VSAFWGTDRLNAIFAVPHETLEIAIRIVDVGIGFHLVAILVSFCVVVVVVVVIVVVEPVVVRLFLLVLPVVIG